MNAFYKPIVRIYLLLCITLTSLGLNAKSNASVLTKPSFSASADGNGFRFQPMNTGPEWTWQLIDFRQGSQSYFEPESCPVSQLNGHELSYQYTDFKELYQVSQRRVEQLFVLDRQLSKSNTDLVIEGAISCSGDFSREGNAWVWRNESGFVALGDVYVFDAEGKRIPAKMEVSASHSRIVIDGAALSMARYPVTIDPEVGTDDFMISETGPAGNASYDATNSDLAYNNTNNEFLIVYVADTVPGQDEIYGRRLDAATGNTIGTPFRISWIGMEGDPNLDASVPAVTWNSNLNQYLVVFAGDSTTNNELEVYGQFVDANGTLSGPSNFRISFQGTNGDIDVDANLPDVAWNSVDNEYMVVWSGDTIASEDEIYGQRLSFSGALMGSVNRITHQGPDGATNYDAAAPAIEYNPVNNEYLVAWTGDTIPTEDEIYVQVLTGSGALQGPAVRVSHLGPDGDNSYQAYQPQIAWNSHSNEYLIVWHGDDSSSVSTQGEFEIFGQVVDASGQDLGSGDFRISDAGPDLDISYDAFDVNVAYSADCQEYLVTWRMDDDEAHVTNGKSEIFVQRVNEAGLEIGSDSIISNTAPLNDIGRDSYKPAVGYNSTDQLFLVIWESDDSTGGHTNNEFDVHGQLWACNSVCTAPSLLGGGGQADVCENDNTQMTLSDTGDVDSLQWQLSTDGGSTWSFLNDDATYTGTHSNSLSIANHDLSFDGNLYRLLVWGCGGLADSSAATILNVFPSVPNIVQNGDTLCTTGFDSYQWNLNGNPILGATDSCYIATATGNYTVTVMNFQSGCGSTSDSTNVVVGLESRLDTQVKVYPNPNQGAVRVEIQEWKGQSVTLALFTLEGKQVLVQKEGYFRGGSSLNLLKLPKGLYILKVENGDQEVYKTLSRN